MKLSNTLFIVLPAIFATFNAVANEPISDRIEASISAQTLQKAPVKASPFDTVYAELQDTIATLAQAEQSADFIANARAAKTLALQAKQHSSDLLIDTGDRNDNYRLASDVTYTVFKLNRLIDTLDTALISAQKGQIQTAKAIAADLSVRS